MADYRGAEARRPEIERPSGVARSPLLPFISGGWSRSEGRAWSVALISLIVMAGELSGGAWLNSMALVSDGLHTATHAAVMVIAAGAYAYSRKRAHDPRFLNGPRKVTDLAAFASGVALAMTAFILAVESIQRLISPEPVRFVEAAWLTGLGMAISLVSATILGGAHAQAHGHAGAGAPHAHGRDLNLWAAYLHMVADVITSIIALGALLVGAATGWTQLDASVGLLNAAVVAGFSVRLLRAASAAILDYDPDRRSKAA